MKQSLRILLFSLTLFLSPKLFSQNLEVIGKVKIGTVDKVNSADSILVLLTNGTLAFRDASSFEFVPYIGATQAVDLGAFDLKVNGLTVGLGGGSNSRNTAIGKDALYANTSGSWNMAIGGSALNSNTEGFGNSAMGKDALYANTTGDWNTASGALALNSNTTGINNTANGVDALRNNTEGNYNTASGYRALRSNTTGSYNTANGNAAHYSNTTGSFNTASGINALFSNTEGGTNTASGYSALSSNTTGSFNTANGSHALSNNITGSYNTAIGYSTYFTSSDLTNATVIGAMAIVNASNKVRIGDANVTAIEGQVAFSASSDRRLKEEISSVTLGKDFVNDLNPVQYHRKSNEDEDVEMGIIAQELLMVLEKHGLGKSGMVSQPKGSDQYMSVRYNDLLAPMIKAIQELSQENEMLKSEVKRIDESLEAIKAMLSNKSR